LPLPLHEIVTARLDLTPLAPRDAGDLHLLWTAPAMRQFIWDGDLISFSHTAMIAGENLPLFAACGYGIWGVRLRDNPALLGFAGLSYVRNPELELVFGIDPRICGRGFATECVRAVLRYGFEELDFARVNGSADTANAAAVRVMERVGMRFDRRQVLGPFDTVYYTLAQEDFHPDAARWRLLLWEPPA
jgi:[ribosomal protein S5]-alanine N-acetyltransferase